MSFRGSLVALVTPFNSKGSLDRKALASLVEWQIEQGIDGIVCCATTGEGPALSASEIRTVAEICIRTAGKRVPIIVSTGAPSTKETIRLTESALKLGADGCLVVTPFYNRPSQRGCVAHFTEVAKVGLPMILYHNPGRAGLRLTVETVVEIGNIPGVVGYKDSNHDLDFIRRLKKLSSISILSGDDDLTFATMKEGAVGGICPIANLIPKSWSRMIHLSIQGKWGEASQLNERYMPLIRSLYTETNPQCFKFVLDWFGKIHGHLRLPLLTPSWDVQLELKRQFCRLALPQWSLIRSLQDR
jgi:4-hydroxy-tetrahydrodipicolinate synthase